MHGWEMCVFALVLPTLFAGAAVASEDGSAVDEEAPEPVDYATRGEAEEPHTDTTVRHSAGNEPGTMREVVGLSTTGNWPKPDPPRVEVLWLGARVTYTAGEYDAAAESLGRLYEEQGHPDLLYNMAQALRRADHHAEALDVYRRYVAVAHPPASVAHVHIGECLLALDRREEADRAFERYLALDPDGQYAAFASRAIETGISIEVQMRRDPRTVEAAQALYDRAAALVERGQHREAAEVFLDGYAAETTVHELLFNAGCCYQEGGLWSEALEVFRRYLQTPGAEARAYAFMAECLHAQGQHADAVQAYRDYLKRERNGRYAQDALDYVYTLTQGRTDGTLTVPANEARERATAAFSRGMEHHRAGQYQEAVREFGLSHEAMPTRHALFMLAFSYEQLEQWQEALARYETLLSSGDTGEDAVAHLNAARCLVRLERPADAEGEVHAYMQRAEEADLPDEQANLESARTLLRICDERRSREAAD